MVSGGFGMFYKSFIFVVFGKNKQREINTVVMKMV